MPHNAAQSDCHAVAMRSKQACVDGAGVAQVKSLAQAVFTYFSIHNCNNNNSSSAIMIFADWLHCGVWVSVSQWSMYEWTNTRRGVAWLAAKLNGWLERQINIRSAAVACLLLYVLLATLIYKYVRFRCEYWMNWMAAALWQAFMSAQLCCMLHIIYFTCTYFYCASACVWYNVISNNDLLSD